MGTFGSITLCSVSLILSGTNCQSEITLMNVHFLLLGCSALSADKAWLLTDLHVTSCLPSTAAAPASVNTSTTKLCCLSGCLQPPPSAERSENPPQSPWAGRDSGDHLVLAWVESWFLPRTSSGRTWSIPSPRHLRSHSPRSPSLPFWASPHIHHPPHCGGPWPGRRQQTSRSTRERCGPSPSQH